MAIEGIDERGWLDIPVTPERKGLDRLVRTVRKGQDIERVVTGLPFDCELLEQPTMGTDCEFYVFKRKGVVGEFARTSSPILKPEPNDVALYTEDDLLRHVGVVSEDGRRIDSKWGMFGPVIRHPVGMVLPIYGTAVCFRRR